MRVKIEKTPAAVYIQAGYSEFEAASNISITIHTPAVDNNQHQNGQTDKNGVFLFLPDRAGLWKVILDDKMGHRKEVEIEISQLWIDKKYEQINIETSTPGLPIYYKIIIGISLFWGFTGLLYWRKTKQIQKGA